MNKIGQCWLVNAEFQQQKHQLSNVWTTYWPEKAFKTGCVRANTELEAFEAGKELLGHPVTHAITLAEIDAGWVLGEE